jgi:hypothetical protein
VVVFCGLLWPKVSILQPVLVQLFHIKFENNLSSILGTLYVFFWVIPWRLNFICWRFGTLCLFHLHRQVGVEWFYTCLPIKTEQTECSETLAYEIQTPGNYPEEHIQHTEHGKSLKSRIFQVQIPCLRQNDLHISCFLFLGNKTRNKICKWL